MTFYNLTIYVIYDMFVHYTVVAYGVCRLFLWSLHFCMLHVFSLSFQFATKYFFCWSIKFCLH